MADPLSVAGLAIGVVSLGLQVTGGITDYIDALNCRDQDIALLQRDHQAATAAVRECLDSCKKELQVLESLVAELVACDQSTTGRKNKIKNQGKKLLYPLNRPKLEQLGTRLRNVNATLQLALQTLGLSVSQLGTEKLATLEANSHAISTGLLVVQSEVSAMSTPLQGIHSTLSGFETRFDSLENHFKQLLVQMLAINGTPQDITPAVVTGRLLGKPGLLRDICDATGARARPRSSGTRPAMNHGATQIGNAVSTYTGGSFSCLCRHRRRLQRKNVVWGSLTLSLETATEQHLPECPATQIAISSSRDERLLPSQAKPSPLLELLECLLVNKAPANDYDLSGHVTDPLPAAAAELILRSNAEANVACLSEPHPAAISMILDRSGRLVYAEDTAVLLHFLGYSTRIAEAYGCGPLSLAILSNNLEQVEHLVRNHPATLAERDLFGHTPLHLAADKPSCLRLLVEAADARLLNQVDRPDEFGKSALETAVFLSGLRCRERTDRRMCRRCRCAECAVILLKADCALPVSAHLQGVFRLASKRCKLRYARHLKDRRDRLNQLALDNLPATEVERLGLVSERVLDSLASRVIQLLQDRGVCIPEALAVARNGPSSVYQALCCPWDAELFFRVGFHDTDSWCNADAAELENIPNLVQGLPYLHWLAKHGAISCQLKSFESPKGIFTAHYTFWRIGENLESSSFYWSWDVFHDPLPLPFAARRAWFHELNAAVLPANIADACRCKCSPEGCNPLTSLLKGALRGNSFGYEPRPSPEDSVAEDTESSEHSVAEVTESSEHSVAEVTESSEHSVAEVTDSSEHSVAEVTDSSEHSVAEDTDFPDHNIAGVTGPPSELITEFTLYLARFWGHLEVRHHIAALRYLTYTALGIPHSCCNPYDCGEIFRESFAKDVEEVEDEHAYELGLLEELLGEFKEELIAILQDPDRGITDLIGFWKRTWVGRIKEVLDRLKRSDLTDDERRGAEEIGVVWDKMGPEPPKVIGNPYRRTTLDHWMYELEKIEAECQ
ncbi:hypothetical protein DL768_007749 [Monosporascus sp. mg162]|nr:hypothetical protein DL768_007749 [Monosporascus sp. mg162]